MGGWGGLGIGAFGGQIGGAQQNATQEQLEALEALQRGEIEAEQIYQGVIRNRVAPIPTPQQWAADFEEHISRNVQRDLELSHDRTFSNRFKRIERTLLPNGQYQWVLKTVPQERNADYERVRQGLARMANLRKKRQVLVKTSEARRAYKAQLEAEKQIEGGDVVNNFRVGCDPEFVVLDENSRLMNTGRYVPRSGEIGYDHGGDVVELRPTPTMGTFMLVRNLKNLINKAEGMIPQGGKFRAGAWLEFPENERRERVSLGGHVHLDISPYENETLQRTSEEHLLRIAALDHLTHRLEALDILPKNESALRRRGTYGKFGDYRVQRNGANDVPPERANTYNVGKRSQYHTEYRTMASWLHDPKVAYICLTAAKLAAAEPAFAIETLGRVHSWEAFKKWFEALAPRDVNAQRALDKVLSAGGLKSLQVDPSSDFRPRWQTLGL